MDRRALPKAFLAIATASALLPRRSEAATCPSGPTYPQTPAELSVGVTPACTAYPPLDIRRYGADAGGTSTSDSAMVSAVKVCGATGGVISAPAGTYLFASPIDLFNKLNIVVEGTGTSTPGTTPGTRFSYSGSASPFISWNSAVACQLRNIQVVHTNASFVGPYIQSSNTGGSNGDAALNSVIDCAFGSNVGTTLHIDINKSNNFSAERCTFQYGGPSIRGTQTGGYANAIRFRDCQWANCTSAPIQDGGQAWTFSGCTFEAPSSGKPGGLLSSSSALIFNGLVIESCWFGDASTGTTGSWIDIYGEALSFTGNWISGNTTGATAITLRQFYGALISANNFNSFLVGINFAAATCAEIVIKGNVFNSTTTPFLNGNNVATGTIDWGANYGAGLPGTNHASFATNGFVVEATSIVRQWGKATGVNGGTTTITFPLAFPTVCWNVIATLSGVHGTTSTLYIGIPTQSGFPVTIQDSAGGDTFFWQAIGH